MSDDSDVDDPIDNIDFSVISTAIESGGKTLDQNKFFHNLHLFESSFTFPWLRASAKTGIRLWLCCLTPRSIIIH
jgi:hypothetical protein